MQHFRGLGWDNAKLHDASPFQIVDPGFNAILIRSCADLADLALELGEPALAAANRARARKGDRGDGAAVERAAPASICASTASPASWSTAASIGGLMPVFAAIPRARAHSIARTIEKLAGEVRATSCPRTISPIRASIRKRYWRGPVWLVVNYMIADGLAAAGETAVAEEITAVQPEADRGKRLCRILRPVAGEPLGGGRFTWTAAMVLEFLHEA